MKTFCIHIPRTYLTEATAIWDSNWKVTTGQFMHEHLEELWESMRDTWSHEIYSHEQTVYYSFTANSPTYDVLASTFYSIEAMAEIIEFPDFTKTISDKALVAAIEIAPAKPTVLPFTTFKPVAFNPAEPIAGMLSRIPSDRKVIIQAVVTPRPDSAWMQFNFWMQRLAWRASYMFKPRYYFKEGVVEKVVEEMKEKSKARFYSVNYRIAVIHDPGDSPTARMSPSTEREIMKELTNNVEALFATSSWMNMMDRNEYKMLGGIQYGQKALIPFQKRLVKKPFLMTTMELASIWQIPKMRHVAHAALVLSTKGSPPKKLPTNTEDAEICFFAHSDYRDQRIPFGIKRADRQKHMYVVGKSGVGKSCLLQLLIKNDIDNGFGCAVIDPHGDLIDGVLKMIPRHRINDVIIFDPTDTEFAASFNPLAHVAPDMRLRFTSSLLEVFKQIFTTSWNDQIDQILRFSLLSLLSTPGATLLSLQRMLSDEKYRRSVIDTTDEQSAKDFWENEFEARKEEFHSAAIAPLLNHFGQLLALDVIRNIFGQPINRFNIREIMDQRKILLIKLPRGILGAHNASMLGSIFIAKIFEATMSRADVAPAQRTDFYLYVDEFQNFATSSFEEILSEARKYKLCLTVANQFLGQLTESIRKALIGNVGNLLAFRLGGEDAPAVAGEMKPRFAPEDFINLGFRDFYIKMMIDGEVFDAFSARTLDLDPLLPKNHFAKQCIDLSHKKYSLPMKQAKSIIGNWDSETAQLASQS